jgi:ubiquinone biosynthesis protein COQ4
MKEWIYKLKFIAAFFEVVEDLNKTNRIFDISDQELYKPDNPTLRPVLDQAFQNPGFVELHKRNYLAPQVSLEALRKLPEGSLGRVYADHMISHGLDPEFYRKMEPENPALYIALRLRQTHDLWHVLTGFSTSVIDEQGLQAFYLSQTQVGLSVVLLASAFLHFLKKGPGHVKQLFERLMEGYAMGKKAKYLLGIPLEEKWEMNLNELRRELGIIPVVPMPNPF